MAPRCRRLISGFGFGDVSHLRRLKSTPNFSQVSESTAEILQRQALHVVTKQQLFTFIEMEIKYDDDDAGFQANLFLTSHNRLGVDKPGRNVRCEKHVKKCLR